MSNKPKTPTEKRTDGVIYSHEIRDAKDHAKSLLKKCKEFGNPVKVLLKDTHTGITTVKIVQPVKHS